MKTFIEYFHNFGDKHSACGDRSIIQLDGRMSRFNMQGVAVTHGRLRGYGAYRLIKGDSLLRAAPITEQKRIENPK